MAWLRTFLFALIFYPVTLVIVVHALIAHRIGRDSIRRDARRWARFHYWCAYHLLGIETRVEGVRPSGPVLFAAKHQSMFETLEVLRLLDEPVVVLKRELADMPLFGAVAAAYGTIPVDREGSSKTLRELLAAAKRAVAARRPVLIFPEGTRVAVGDQPALRAGFAGLYRMLALPVVPIALDSGRVWPRKGPKRAGVVTFRFGEPIPPGLPRERIEQLAHAAINALERSPA